jgi:hypothetical protein
MMKKDKNYQRNHLRAPFRHFLLYADDDHVHKARGLNVSEGGMLLDMVPYFPDTDDVSFMTALPQYPYFKNFSLEKLKGFSKELFPSKVIRGKLQLVRRIQLSSSVEEVFLSRIGCRFTEISENDKRAIAEYVDVFASNLIYLQIMIDLVNSEKEYLEKVRVLADILGYNGDEKISVLKKTITHEYISLQWL